jgi:hypothetical protein
MPATINGTSGFGGNLTGNVTGNADTATFATSSLTLAAAQNTTSGTSIDFTGIPSWVKRITVMFDGVSTNGSDNILIQTGSGSFDTSGYIGAGSYIGLSTLATVNSTAGYVVQNGGAANTISGCLCITLLTSNSWVANGVFGFSNTTAVILAAGARGVSGALDRVRITTTGGTNTFDAGRVNISYEG